MYESHAITGPFFVLLYKLLARELIFLTEAALIGESFKGEPLGEALVSELQEPEFDPKRLKVALFEKGLGALLARALVSDEAESGEGGALGGARDPKRSLKDLCLQFQTQL